MPDWGLVGPKHVTYGLDDLGEQAVRLRSPHLWDRRGDVLYITDFREGLGMFHEAAYGEGADVVLVTGFSRQGAYSVRLRAGEDDTQEANLQLAFPVQDPSAAGLEFSFSVAQWTALVTAEIRWYDRTNEYIAIVIYDHEHTQLRYHRDLVTEEVLDDDVALNECTRPEHTLKLVVDMVTGLYARFMLDDQTYSVFDYPVYGQPDNRSPYLTFWITHYGVALHTPDCYIDNVIVTQNEPV